MTRVQTGIFCLYIAEPVLVRKHDTDLMESAALESATAGIKYILLSSQSDWLMVRIHAALSGAAHPSHNLSDFPGFLSCIQGNSTCVLCFLALIPVQSFSYCRDFTHKSHCSLTLWINAVILYSAALCFVLSLMRMQRDTIAALSYGRESISRSGAAA